MADSDSKETSIPPAKRGVAINRRKNEKLQVVKQRLGIIQDTEAVHRVLRWYLMLIDILPGTNAVPIGENRLFKNPPYIDGLTYPKKEQSSRISIKIDPKLAKLLAPKLRSDEGISGCFTLAQLVNQALDTLFPLLGITDNFHEIEVTHSATAKT